MLQLKNIKKIYGSADNIVEALKGVSLNFRKNEFVSILGPSGCGKTTMLNIIGGLDRYTDGDLVINGTSTKNYGDGDWDAYRNYSIGFVFQSYNLIPHMNVLDNVTLALSIAGESKAVRLEKAKIALKKVGLAEQMRKRPNQLSGGQMQRVAIARAIVNNPDIILADEPTGALDSETGVQVMELLKEVAKDRLVIMVTHNEELAEKYSTRIVKLFDGQLVSDSMPYTEQQVQEDEQQTVSAQPVEETPKKRAKRKRVGMSLFTAFGISGRNLLSKKGRTILTSFAGSVGIFGIALVLAISGGMRDFVDVAQQDTIGDANISIAETTYSIDSVMNMVYGYMSQDAYPNIDGIQPYVNPDYTISNNITREYVDYVKQIDSSLYKTMDLTYRLKLNVFSESNGRYSRLSNWSSVASQMVSNGELVEKNYDVLYKSETSETGYPKDYTEISLVVDKFNHLSPSTLDRLGIAYEYDMEKGYQIVPFSDIVDREYYIVLNDGMYYQRDNGLFAEIPSSQYAQACTGENAIKVKIVSVLRIKNNKASNYLTSGQIGYLPSLTEIVLQSALDSAIGKAQLASTDKEVFYGSTFTPTINSTVEKQYINALKNIGAYEIPTNISIIPKNINAKKQITDHLDAWNNAHPNDEVSYLDLSAIVLTVMGTLIDVITYMLVAFSAVSLVVSMVMISVITYTSVVERIKEIGVLRSLGARKRDISAIFNTETFMVGSLAGIIGVSFSVIVGVIVNKLLYKAFEVANIVKMTPLIGLGMLGLSILLTLLAGIIPASLAAKKDPVVALRTE